MNKDATPAWFHPAANLVDPVSVTAAACAFDALRRLGDELPTWLAEPLFARTAWTAHDIAAVRERLERLDESFVNGWGTLVLEALWRIEGGVDLVRKGVRVELPGGGHTFVSARVARDLPTLTQPTRETEAA